MAQEKLLTDFSGGMNALAAVDKLDPRECLLAENIRFDETGNILSAGAYTHQNGTPYKAAAGNYRGNIHSLYWNPSFGGIVGVGQDVFTGTTLGLLRSKLAGKNPNIQKMSFASAPSRVYFDIGSVGYWNDTSNLLTVDWAPPTAGSAITTGPNAAGALTTGGVANTFGFSLGTQGMQGVVAMLVATSTYVNTSGVPQTQVGVFQAAMLVGGVAVGTTTTVQSTHTVLPGTHTYLDTATFGNANSLWGVPTLTPAQVNSSSFGFLFLGTTPAPSPSNNDKFSSAQCTTYQQAPGFSAGTGAAGALTGTYSWKVTFVGTNGEESDGSVDSTNVVLSTQQGTLTGIPTGDSRTASRNIYRIGYAASTALTLHYLVGTIPDNTTTFFTDNMTDLAAITAGVILAGDVPGDYPNSRLGNTPVKYPTYHYDRVFWVNQAQPNQIIWSKPLNGFAYPSINFINVGDSKPISRLVSIFGELIIVKTDSIWRLTGTDENSFDLTPTPSAVGTDQSFTVIALPDKVIFANRWGLWVFNGYTSQPLTNKLDLWFKQLDRTGVSIFGANGFHPPEVTTTAPLSFDAVGNSEKVYLAYAEAGQTFNNALLCFDLKHGNLTKRTINGLPLSVAIDPVTGFVYMGDGNGFVSLLDDWNGTSAGGAGGTAVNFDFQHGYQDFQRGSNKSIWSLEFYINTNGQAVTPYVYYDNGAASEILPSITTTGLQRVVRPLESAASRKCQNFSVRFNASLKPVNQNGTPQIQIVHIKPYFDIRMGRARTGQ